MSTIWNPKKNIPLYQTNDFPAVWKTIIDKPAPGMMVGTGWLTPDWINFRGHREKEYQECVIYHWPREIVPSQITERDKLADLIPHLKDLIGKAVNGADPTIPAELVQSVIGLCHQMFVNLVSGPIGGLPLLNLLNMDGSLTFIYAHWYEGTPSKFQWVLDVNWERYNRVRVFNQQIQQLEIDSSTESYKEVEIPNISLFSTPFTKTEMIQDAIVSETEAEQLIQLLEGRLGNKTDHEGSLQTVLYHPASDNVLINLQSKHLNLSDLPHINDDNLVQAVGTIYTVKGKESSHTAPELIFEVQDIYILRNGRDIFDPPLYLDYIDLHSFQYDNKAVCPSDVRARILKEVAVIKDASSKLSQIEWKKYGAVAIGAGSLLAITVSAAVGILSTSTAAGPAIASYILRSKILSLISIVSSLSTLDSWAKSEAQRLKSASDLIASLKLAHPECFKD